MTYVRHEVIGDCVLYQADCLEVLPTLGKVDCVIADPPYFKVKGEDWDHQWNKPHKYLEWLGQVFDLCSSRMQPWASIYCFASPQMEWFVQGLIRQRFVFLNSIRWRKSKGWHKKQPLEELRVYQQNWEACLLAQKADDSVALEASGYDAACNALHRKVYAPIGNYFREERLSAGKSYTEIANYIHRDPKLYPRWEEGSSLPNPEDYRKCQWLFNGYLRKEYEDLRKEYEDLRRPFNVYDKRMQGDIWDCAPVNGYTGKHPCEKPVSIIQHMIGTSSKQGQIILDPTMGSGTSGVCCVRLDRSFIGIEKTRESFDIACQRIEEAYRQPYLFDDMFVEAQKQQAVQETLF